MYLGEAEFAENEHYRVSWKTVSSNRLDEKRLKEEQPNIKPISDLRNYTEVLKETQEGSPGFLTKNGRGEYVILDMKEYDKMRAVIALML